ncbi:MAG: hypothetical protein R6X20_10975 [Phycisphaerae bacterium]
MCRRLLLLCLGTLLAAAASCDSPSPPAAPPTDEAATPPESTVPPEAATPTEPAPADDPPAPEAATPPERPSPAGGTFALTRKTATAGEMPALRMGTRFCPRRSGPNQGLTGVPPDAAEADAFYTLHLDEGLRWAVCVPGDPPRLLVDTDNDKDFADETPITGEVQQTSIDYGTVDLALKDGGTATVRLMGNAMKPGDPPRYMLMMPGAYCTGTVTLAGKEYALAVIDGNMNGRFNDAFAGEVRYSDLDGLALDLNGNGTFDLPRGMEGPFETTPLGKRLRVGEAFYDVTPAPDGSQITLQPVEPGFGTVDVGTAEAALLAYSDYGIWQTTTSAEGTVRLPAGRYAVIRLAVKKKDASGQVWQLTMTEPPKTLQPLVVEQGKTLRVAVGPPLVAEVDVQQRNRQARLNLMLRGAAGERYVPGVQKGNRRTPPPTFEILGDDDKVLHTGKFEYG